MGTLIRRLRHADPIQASDVPVLVLLALAAAAIAALLVTGLAR